MQCDLTHNVLKNRINNLRLKCAPLSNNLRVSHYGHLGYGSSDPGRGRETAATL